jgi:hypothetical protein
MGLSQNRMVFEKSSRKAAAFQIKPARFSRNLIEAGQAKLVSPTTEVLEKPLVAGDYIRFN